MAWLRDLFAAKRPDLRGIMAVEGDGKTPATAFKLIPHDFDLLQKKAERLILDARTKLQAHDIDDAALVKGVLAEMCKMLFLDSRLDGERGRDFTLGPREYLEGTSLQGQAVSFRDGRAAAIYCDFSVFDSHFGTQTPRPDTSIAGGVVESDAHSVLLNIELLEHPAVLLMGRLRSLEMTAVTLATLLTVGRQCGWKGGTDFFRSAAEASVLRNFAQGMTLPAEDAYDLSQKLRHSQHAIDGEAFETSIEFVEFLAEGGFTLGMHRRG